MSRNADIACRGCGSTNCTKVGLLPGSHEFAGMILPVAIPGGALFRCRSCALVFRSPILATEEYNRLYAQAAADVWTAGTGGELRADQQIVKSHIEAQRPLGANVLDIGCYTGAFLSSLPARYRKFGVEKCERAARQCSDHGITILGEDLYQLGALDRKFDIVTAMDVIEHTANPGDFLRSLLNLLEDGGLALLTTGDADNSVWRQVNGAFWYCANAEHISFISPTWLNLNARANDFQVTHLRRFRYLRRSNLQTVAKRFVIGILSTAGIPSRTSWTAHISADHLFAAVRR